MPAKKPTKLMILKGTLEANKKSTKNRIDDKLIMLNPDCTVEVPVSITNEKVKSIWNATTNTLLGWNILSAIDLPELEEAFLILQELQRINEQLKATEVADENYSKVLHNKLKAVKVFHDLMKNYGLSPVERTKLTLTVTEIKMNESLLDKIQGKQ